VETPTCCWAQRADWLPSGGPGPGGCGWQRRRRSVGVQLLTRVGIDAVLADNVVPQIVVLHPDSARAAIRETFSVPRHRWQAPVGIESLPRHGGRAPHRRSSSPRSSSSPPAWGSDLLVSGRGGRRRRRRYHRRAHGRRGGPEAGRPVAVRRRRHPGQPKCRGDLGVRWSAVTTVERGLEAGSGRRGRGARLARRARGLRADTRAPCPAIAGDRALDLRLAEVRGRGSTAPARRAGNAWRSGPADGWSSATEWTCVKSICWWDPVASFGMHLHIGPRRSYAQQLATRSRVGGCFRALRGWPSTGCTCSRRAGLLAKEHPRQAYLLARRYLSG
jgi:hypothetical protein